VVKTRNSTKTKRLLSPTLGLTHACSTDPILRVFPGGMRENAICCSVDNNDNKNIVKGSSTVFFKHTLRFKPLIRQSTRRLSLKMLHAIEDLALSSYTGSQEPKQKTQQCSIAKQRFVKKGVQWLFPLCTGTPGHNRRFVLTRESRDLIKARLPSKLRQQAEYGMYEYENHAKYIMNMGIQIG